MAAAETATLACRTVVVRSCTAFLLCFYCAWYIVLLATLLSLDWTFKRLSWLLDLENQRSRPVDWSQLPDNVLHHMANYLDDHDCRQARAVCRSWRTGCGRSVLNLRPGKLAEDAQPQPWPIPVQLVWSLIAGPAAHAWLALIGVYWGYFFPPPAVQLSRVADGFRNLASLNLSSCSASVTDARLQGLKPLGPSLRALNLSGCAEVRTKGILALQPLSQLVLLNLTECTRVDNWTLELLPETLPSLSSLVLDGNPWISAAGVRHLSRLRHLSILSLAGCPDVGDSVAAALGQLTGLTSLNLSWSKKLTDAGVSHLSALTGLQYLKLRGCRKLLGETLGALAPLGSLLRLDLSCSPQLTSAALEQLAGLPSLVRLQLDGCSQLKSLAVLDRSASLKRVDAAGVPALVPKRLRPKFAAER